MLSYFYNFVLVSLFAFELSLAVSGGFVIPATAPKAKQSQMSSLTAISISSRDRSRFYLRSRVKLPSKSKVKTHEFFLVQNIGLYNSGYNHG